MILLKSSYSHKIKVLDLPCQLFPYFISKKLINEYFEFVGSNPDIVFLPIINEATERANISNDYWTKYMNLSTNYAVFHTLDEFQNRSKFSKNIQDLCDQCDYVFGHQLPTMLDTQKYIPLMYPALVKSYDSSTKTQPETIDLFFWGAYDVIPNRNIPISTSKRERSYRGSVVSIIENLQIKHSWVTDIRRLYYWEMGQIERKEFQAKYLRRMLSSKLCLSLYGYGFNSFRTSEIFALQRALVSPKVFKHILVPELDLWENGDLGFFFSDDCSDLESILLQALSNNDERKRKAENGKRFYERNCSNEGIIQTVYKTVLQGL
jgi:hypothetical protein